MQILLTGASGFLGRQLIKELVKEDLQLRIAVRDPETLRDSALVKEISVFTTCELSTQTNWQNALKDVDLVIHAAARAHIMNDKAENPLAEFRKINVDATLHLAKQAAQAGVKRFIFISSIKVNGESTPIGKPFRADDLANPTDPYARSKYEAEQGLLELAAKSGMELVIIRPPLVYGPGVKGNFQRLTHWLQKGLPLPLGAINNKRSFVAIENLTSLIKTCLDNPRAANQIFLVSDDEDLSTTELLKQIGSYLAKPARLLPIPEPMLKIVAALTRQNEVYQRLCASLQVDISKTKEMLDWKPQVSIKEALVNILKEA